MALTDTARTVLVLVSGCARAAEHPILKLRELVDGVLREMCGLFEARYAKNRPAIDSAGASATRFAAARGLQRERASFC